MATSAPAKTRDSDFCSVNFLTYFFHIFNIVFLSRSVLKTVQMQVSLVAPIPGRADRQRKNPALEGKSNEICSGCRSTVNTRHTKHRTGRVITNYGEQLYGLVRHLASGKQRSMAALFVNKQRWRTARVAPTRTVLVHGRVLKKVGNSPRMQEENHNKSVNWTGIELILFGTIGFHKRRSTRYEKVRSQDVSILPLAISSFKMSRGCYIKGVLSEAHRYPHESYKESQFLLSQINKTVLHGYNEKDNLSRGLYLSILSDQITCNGYDSDSDKMSIASVSRCLIVPFVYRRGRAARAGGAGGVIEVMTSSSTRIPVLGPRAVTCAGAGIIMGK
ncbi:hypothetical protein J6590_008052 [Homalodisca vitripennis]|nr:hypothetical protein J6590_008052 [Homalodisca vitripennis]